MNDKDQFINLLEIITSLSNRLFALEIRVIELEEKAKGNEE